MIEGLLEVGSCKNSSRITGEILVKDNLLLNTTAQTYLCVYINISDVKIPFHKIFLKSTNIYKACCCKMFSENTGKKQIISPLNKTISPNFISSMGSNIRLK